MCKSRSSLLKMQLTATSTLVMPDNCIYRKESSVETKDHNDDQPLPIITLDQLSIDTLRLLAVDAVEKAKSGHPGAPLGCAPIAYLLFHKLMKHNPAHFKWPDRDRFVLSNGHASALLYSRCISPATT